MVSMSGPVSNGETNTAISNIFRTRDALWPLTSSKVPVIGDPTASSFPRWGVQDWALAAAGPSGVGGELGAGALGWLGAAGDAQVQLVDGHGPFHGRGPPGRHRVGDGVHRVHLGAVDPVPGQPGQGVVDPA